MEPAATIGRLGFRRWYERQLIEAHAWLISCFLCMLAIAACVEVMSLRGPPLQTLSYAAAVAADLFRASGWSVLTADSPWRLGSDDTELIAEWLDYTVSLG